MLPNFEYPEDAVTFAAQKHFANVLRLCRGSGNIYDMHESMVDLQTAMQRHFNEAGDIPPAGLITKAATSWDERAGTGAEEARRRMYKGALQIVASGLLGQSLPQSKGEDQFNGGFQMLAEIQQERRQRSAHLAAVAEARSRPAYTPSPRKDGAEDLLYFISDGKAIKIGVSNAPLRRLRGLQTAHHSELKLVATTSGGYDLERELHERFGEHRLAGEWFSDVPEIREFISGLAANDNQKAEDVPAEPSVQNM